jgi:transcription initiation factor TFIIF subunit beta
MADAANVKTEQQEASPAAVGTPVDEEDLYEDAGDLEFYSKAPGTANETLYLARVPKYVWENWMKVTERMGDNDEIRIGTLRTWNEKAEGGGDAMEVSSWLCSR